MEYLLAFQFLSCSLCAENRGKSKNHYFVIFFSMGVASIASGCGLVEWGRKFNMVPVQLNPEAIS